MQREVKWYLEEARSMRLTAQENAADGAAVAYKSPQRKLVNFFERSRNNWKAKHAGAKGKLKQLEHRVRYLEKSKAHYKAEVKELKRKLGQSQQTLEREQKKKL